MFRHGRGYINGAAPTNSSVVGPDNGWALNTPSLHDFPGVDVELSGIGYQTLIPFALDPKGGTSSAKTTYAHVAFGAPLPPGNKVPAPTPANPQHGIIAGGGTGATSLDGFTAYSGQIDTYQNQGPVSSI